MSLRRPLAIALASSVALAGLITVAATSASGAPPTNVQIRVATDDTTVWAAVLTLRSAGSGSSDIAVNGPDDTVYVIGGGDAAGEVDALSVINGTTGVLDDTYTLPGNGGLYIAVDQNDDTIYTSARPGPVSDFNGRTVQSRSPASPGTAVTDDTVPYAYVIAVNSQDDTVYVARTSGTGITFFSGRTPLSDDTRIVGGTTWAIAVDQSDDTVAMSFTTDDSVRFMAGATNALDSFLGGVGDEPSSIAINSPDDTIYVANSCSSCRTVQVINGQTAAVGTPIYLPLFGGLYNMKPEAPRGLAVDESTDMLFVAGSSTNRLGVINGANTDDSVYLSTGVGGAGGSPKSFQAFKSLAVDDSGTNQGLLWGVTYTGYVQAVTQVQPQLQGSTSGAAGATVSFSVTPTSLTLPFLMSDNAVWGVRFNGSGSDIPATRVPGTNEWTATLPSGLPTGNVPVEVLFNGSQYAFAGTYTVQSSGPTPPPPPPPPPPLFPPGPPTNVTAVAGDGQASVSWTPPTDVGASAIIEYDVTSAPGYRSCRVTAPTTSCTVTGLINGVSYTFTVEARNGDGWGQDSSPSNAVTPKAPSIVITGSRDSADTRFVQVQGTTTDLVGKQVTPYVRFPGQLNYTAGIGVQMVAADGTFAWSRKTGKKISVYFVNANVRSNTVVITAR